MTRYGVSGHSTCVVSGFAVKLKENLDAPLCAPGSSNLLPTLGEIYQEYAIVVFRNLRRVGVAEAQLEDAVQDVFMVVHRRLGQFESRSTLKTWILGITLRVAKDYRRAEARFSRKLDHWAARLSSDAPLQPSPSDAVEQKEAGQLLHHLLLQLPSESREMLVLVELEGLSVREACDALNIRLRTGQRRLQAGIETISRAVSHLLSETRRQP